MSVAGDRVSVKWYCVRADYRPESATTPRYYYKSTGDIRYVRNWFREHYPWLTVYEVLEVAEQDVKWAMRI